MTIAKSTIEAMPIIHPNWAMAHAKESTPAPITAVMICALAVHGVPAYFSFRLEKVTIILLNHIYYTLLKSTQFKDFTHIKNNNKYISN